MSQGRRKRRGAGWLSELRGADKSIFRFFTPALLSRRWHVAQWDISSTLDLRSGVTVGETKVWCDGL